MVELKNTGLEETVWLVADGEVGGPERGGQEELVLGNIGENFYLRPDEDHPVKLWMNDFDKTGTMDHFLTRHVAGEGCAGVFEEGDHGPVPVPEEREPAAREYAKKQMWGLFGEELVKSSRRRSLILPVGDCME